MGCISPGKTISRFTRLAASGALMLSMVAPAAADAGCAMPGSFDDPDYVLYEDAKALFWVRPLHVDADGSPKAYHRDDPHGNKGLAIEYIGNGMTIERDGKPIEFNPREEDNREWLSAYWSIVKNGWKTPPGLLVDIYGFAWDEGEGPCVGRGGRLVSTTSLSRPAASDYCSQSRYFDALEFPGIVVPNRAEGEAAIPNADPEVAPPFAARGVRRGDLAIVYNPATGIWKGAFLYDTGPRKKLGEGSVRLVMNLTGRKRPPRSASETNSMSLPETFFLLFPGSVSDLGAEQDWTPERIETAAAGRFKEWGGGSLATALKRLLACADEHSIRKP